MGNKFGWLGVCVSVAEARENGGGEDSLIYAVAFV